MANPLVEFDSPRKIINDASNGGEVLQATTRLYLGPSLVATKMPASPAPGDADYVLLDVASQNTSSAVRFPSDADPDALIDGIVKDAGNIVRVGAASPEQDPSAPATQVLLAAQSAVRARVNGAERLTMNGTETAIAGPSAVRISVGGNNRVVVTASSITLGEDTPGEVNLLAGDGGESTLRVSAAAMFAIVSDGGLWGVSLLPVDGVTGRAQFDDGESSFFEFGCDNDTGTVDFVVGRAHATIDVAEDIEIKCAGAPLLKLNDQGWAFNGATPGTPTITGSRGGNAALADLLTKLAAQGLIIDGTTA